MSDKTLREAAENMLNATDWPAHNIAAASLRIALADSADAPEGPYQMDVVDDIPPELKEKIGRAVAEEITRQAGVVDHFKIWRAGLVPCRERLNQRVAEVPEEIITICEHGVVTSDRSCPQCDNGTPNGR